MGDLNQQLKSGFLFDQMKDYLASDAGKESAKKVGFVYQFNIAPKKLGLDEVIYIVDLIKCEVIKVISGAYEGGKPDATFSFVDEDYLKIVIGKMNPQLAFLRGKIKMQGSITAAIKFTPDIFPKPTLP
ncbi:sterol carrier protein 2-like isoform X1 [Silene latifolia]|uniref:sterol carrier protein 2-like isoform X1 n=1 Tax=Silene latifolia TaxID=37657 RepID=UPI003D7790BA